jgi:hypothetical protein
MEAAMFDLATADAEALRYLPPVCGSVGTGLSCYLSLYHQGEHLAPDPSAPVDSGRLVAWGRALEAC